MKVTFPKSMGTLWLFLLGLEVNFKLFFFPLQYRNKTWNRSQIWINTIIQQSEYAKEKNTRQLRIRAGMQKKWSYLKRSTKDKMLMIADVLCLRRMATDGKPIYGQNMV